MKKTNSCRISRKSVRFEPDTWTNAHDFLEKSFLVSQYDISSETHCKFSEARARAKNLHPSRFDNNWNGHKKFKNDRNNVKLSRGVILCHIVTIKKYQTWNIAKISKKPYQNGLSCLMFNGFQAKWPMLCLESRHSLW